VRPQHDPGRARSAIAGARGREGRRGTPRRGGQPGLDDKPQMFCFSFGVLGAAEDAAGPDARPQEFLCYRHQALPQHNQRACWRTADLFERFSSSAHGAWGAWRNYGTVSGRSLQWATSGGGFIVSDRASRMKSGAAEGVCRHSGE